MHTYLYSHPLNPLRLGGIVPVPFTRAVIRYGHSRTDLTLVRNSTKNIQPNIPNPLSRVINYPHASRAVIGKTAEGSTDSAGMCIRSDIRLLGYIIYEGSVRRRYCSEQPEIMICSGGRQGLIP